jgi:hypothetical protein
MAVETSQPVTAPRGHGTALKHFGRSVYRWLMKSARLAHLVLSMLGLLVLLLFGLTGLILNHPDWFDHYDSPQETTHSGELPAKLVKKPLNQLLVVEHLRSEYGVTEPLYKFAERETGATVLFSAPGREHQFTIDFADEETEPAKVEVISTSYGLMGRLADLHRGQGSKRATGDTWPWVIDSAAVLMVLLGLTGLILMSSLKTRRWLGLGALSLGAGLLLGVYFLLVP